MLINDVCNDHDNWVSHPRNLRYGIQHSDTHSIIQTKVNKYFEIEVFRRLNEHITESRKRSLYASFKTIFRFESHLEYIQDFTARLDRNGEGGGLLVYVKSDITMRQLKSFKFEIDMECIYFEINLRGKKWVFFNIYRPPSQSQDHFFKNLGKAVDHYSEKVDNYLSFGDLNTVETDQQIRNFMDSYDLNNLVKEPACFRAENSRCIDLILTNRYRSFQHTTTFETGLSDFHKMIVTVLKTTYARNCANCF